MAGRGSQEKDRARSREIWLRKNSRGKGDGRAELMKGQDRADRDNGKGQRGNGKGQIKVEQGRTQDRTLVRARKNAGQDSTGLSRELDRENYLLR